MQGGGGGEGRVDRREGAGEVGEALDGDGAIYALLRRGADDAVHIGDEAIGLDGDVAAGAAEGIGADFAAFEQTQTSIDGDVAAATVATANGPGDLAVPQLEEASYNIEIPSVRLHRTRVYRTVIDQ